MNTTKCFSVSFYLTSLKFDIIIYLRFIVDLGRLGTMKKMLSDVVPCELCQVVAERSVDCSLVFPWPQNRDLALS